MIKFEKNNDLMVYCTEFIKRIFKKNAQLVYKLAYCGIQIGVGKSTKGNENIFLLFCYVCYSYRLYV